jgi:hypothetical protein
MQKEIRVLRDTGANVQQALHDAEAEINRLKTLETLPAGAMRSGLEEEELTTAVPVQGRGAGQGAPSQRTIATTVVSKRTALVPCPQVWALLGKGKGTKEIATLLRTSAEHIVFCEQKVGQSTLR